MTYKYSTTTNKYSVPRKLHILSRLAEGQLTDAEAISEYRLSPKLLRQWRKWRYLRIIKKYNYRTMAKTKKTAAKHRKTDAQKLAEAERKIKELEKELKWQTLRADTLDKFVDISEEMFNIPIRKKPDSEQ